MASQKTYVKDFHVTLPSVNADFFEKKKCFSHNFRIKFFTRLVNLLIAVRRDHEGELGGI